MSHCIKLFTGVQNDKIKVWHPNWIKQLTQQAPFSKEQQLLSLLYPLLLWDLCRSPLCTVHHLPEWITKCFGLERPWRPYHSKHLPERISASYQAFSRFPIPVSTLPCLVCLGEQHFWLEGSAGILLQRKHRSAAHPVPKPAHGAATPPDLVQSEMGNAMLGSHN